MSEALAYLNGRTIPVSQAAVPIYDLGFLQGTTVAEQLRTFGGKLFRLDDHLARLAQSLAIVGVDPGLTLAELRAIAEDLARRNHALLGAGNDLNLIVFVTPGGYSALAPAGYGPAVCVHTVPLPFRFWARKYLEGESLATTDFQQVPAECWPPQLKCRSRMHYYLADREAREKYAGARALMLDRDGFVTEATTANLAIHVAGQGLATPPHAKVLPGISLRVLAQLAGELGIPLVERNLTAADVAVADEVLLTSTSPCILPVTRLNGRAIGKGVPGPVHQQLLAAWSNHVGIDIAKQANHFASRA